MTASSRHLEVPNSTQGVMGASRADCGGDLASPVGCGVQETEQRAKRNLWAEAAGMHRRGRRL